MKKQLLRFMPFIVFCILLAITYNTTHYTVYMPREIHFAGAVKDALYEEIEEKAEKYERDPQDAKIDPVWKLTPGYNGLEVDVDASYRNMKKKGEFDENKLIYKQNAPKVHLEDLGAYPIYRGHPDKPTVAFAVNVAWGNEYIPTMLEVLKKHRVKATFFLEGRWAKENTEMAKMIVDAGQEIGNHSYSHPDMKTLSNERIKEELTKTNDVIESVTDREVKLFAPPSGSYRDDVVKIAHDLDMHTIMWSVDTIDWQKPSEDVLVSRVMEKVHPGAIVLMHPTKSTASSLDRLIREVKEKGYDVRDVSTLLNEERPIKTEQLQNKKMKNEH
ncbi:polysaccharide deacetylase family protein [Priestia filamentosa]|uniref:polysaccharide deacetylase family protein n=1 Tax=Priestia filamentosa TaxID=1402861 RepID=UPI0002FA377E|nr:polysaccharide deacetylase family protein [Priestia filamentosa]